MNSESRQEEKLLITRMTKEDVPEVAAIEREAFSDPWSEESFASELDWDYALYLTVRLKEDSSVAGYCGLLQSGTEAEIVNVAVRNDCRNLGIGCRMLTRLMEMGKERKVEHFTLEVRKSNAPAIHLYEKLGFTPAGIRREFYEKPTEDALILWT